MNLKKDDDDAIPEVQKTITEKRENFKATEDEFRSVLKIIAPGTSFRTGLNGILKAGKGALIALENTLLQNIVDGGFRLNSKFTPQKLIELSKMDGAIILSKDWKKIVLANALLTPDSRISSNETGTRHKAAERTAKQTGAIVIAVSERRNEITVYYKDLRYPLLESNELLRKANEDVQMLEKQRELFDNALEKLNRLEFRNYPSIGQAVKVLQKGEIIRKMAVKLQKDIIELGKEGVMLRLRLKEITVGVDEETNLAIRDYTLLDQKKSQFLLRGLSYEDLTDKEEILKVLGYESFVQSRAVEGWRILSKTTLSDREITMLIEEFKSLPTIISANKGLHEKILGPERSTLFENEIEQIKMNL